MTPRWPATADLPDLGDVIAHFQPLPSRDPNCFPVAEDPGLHRYAPNADRHTLTALTADTDQFIADLDAMVADVERVTGQQIRPGGDYPKAA